jgi:thioesterase domain-containing protein
VEAAAASYLGALDRLRPEGPVHLLGHSHGGWVVFEMARRLRAAGRDVLSLTLIDSEVPGESRQTREHDRTQATLRFIEAIELAVERSMQVAAADLEARGQAEELTLLHDNLVRFGLLPGRSKADVLRGPLRTFATCLRTTYRPLAQYLGPVRLVLLDHPRGDQETNQRQAEQMTDGWRQFAPDLIAVRGPGNHMTALKPPHVRVLASWLRADLGMPPHRPSATQNPRDGIDTRQD